MGTRKTSWSCHDCSKKYTKATDKLMECEFCSDYFCCKCLNMGDEEYLCLKKSTCMWFCVECKPKVEEKIKDSEIERLCNKHFEKYASKLDKLTQDLKAKLDKKEVENMIDSKLSALDGSIPNKEIISELIQKQVEQQSFAEVVNKKVDYDKTIKQSVNREVVSKVDVIEVDTEKDEYDREMMDRQNREQNVIIFNMQEPKTNVITERQKIDIEEVNKLIEYLQVESFEEVSVEKVARMGIRPKDVETKPRPLIVKFTNCAAKRAFLRYSYGLKDSEDENIKNISVQNDMSKKDRDVESELVKEMKQKNLETNGQWKHVIRGPPGERSVIKIKINQTK